MSELALEKNLRLELKAQANSLKPVVLLGAAGLTEAVVAEIDRALDAHGLIKVRVPLDDRAEREAIFADIADRVGAARVHAIGRLIVLYRPPPPADPPEAPEPVGRGGPGKAPRPRKRQR